MDDRGLVYSIWISNLYIMKELHSGMCLTTGVILATTTSRFYRLVETLYNSTLSVRVILLLYCDFRDRTIFRMNLTILLERVVHDHWVRFYPGKLTTLQY